MGGFPKRITFDNPKTLVKKVFRGHLRDEHPDFIAFRSHYLFEANFCNPARGNEKGHVEGLVGCVRRNALVPIPEVASLSELNEILEQWCIKDQERRYNDPRCWTRVGHLRDGRYPISSRLRLTKQIDKSTLLIIDELGYVPLTQEGRNSSLGY